MRLLLFNILVFTLLVFTSLIAQTSGSEAKEAIMQLESSVLIVRLDMKKNVLDSYEDIILNPKTSPKQKRLAEERFNRLKDERIRYKQNVMKALESSYSFSTYAFIDNSDIELFQNGDNSVLVAEDQLLRDKISAGHYFFLIKGDSDTHWIITDQNFKAIKSPFPSNHDLGLRRFFGFLVKNDEFDLANENKVFSKMQSRLDKFLLKTMK